VRKLHELVAAVHRTAFPVRNRAGWQQAIEVNRPYL
jgi:hypothetical protein